MQSADDALTAAIEADARSVKARVWVDWYRLGVPDDAIGDLSDLVDEVSIDRSLVTQLPDAARLVVGYSSASARFTVRRGFTVGSTAARDLSPYHPGSPLAGVTRVGAPVTVEVGMDTATGVQRLPAFAGLLRSLDTRAGTAEVGVEALDLRERMRGSVTLPVVVADAPAGVFPNALKPGLDGQWIIDYVARRCGFHASPAERPSCVLSATLHGSAYPEVGTLRQAYWWSGTDAQEPVRFTPGVHGSALAGPDVATLHANYVELGVTTPISCGDGDSLFVQGWFEVESDTSVYPRELISLGAEGEMSRRVVIAMSSFPGWLEATVTRDGASWVSWPLADLSALEGQRVYIGVHLTFGPIVEAVVRYGDQENATEAPVTPWDSVPLTYAALGDLSHEALQVTTEPYTWGMWDDGFVPTAILDPSLNPLTAVPLTDSAEAWSIVQQVAEAEGGVILGDEAGRLCFHGRDWLATPTPVLIVSTRDHVTGLDYTEAIDSVRNHVRVPAAPLTLRTANDIWAASETYKVPAKGTLTVWADMGAPIYQADNTYVKRTSPAQGSGYLAARNPDGTGGEISNLTVTGTVFTRTVKMVVSNPNTFPAYLVVPTGYQTAAGTPWLAVAGQVVVSAAVRGDATVETDGAVVGDATDGASIDAYGEQLLEVPANPWRQSLTAAQSLADALVAQLKDPQVVITGLDIVADPRLQLGDVVEIADPREGGVEMDLPAVVTSINSRVGVNGYEMSIGARAVGPSGAWGQWLAGLAGHSEAGVTTVADNPRGAA